MDEAVDEAVSDRKTQVMMIPGISCALCGDANGPALHVAVFGPGNQPRMPRICQDCLSAVLGAALQLLGHAGPQVAAVAVELYSTGHAPVS